MSGAAAGDGTSAAPSARGLRLVPMSAAEFEVFVARTVREYAHDKILAGQWRDESAEALARLAVTSLLPDGLATADHHLYVLRDADTGGRVGTAWLHFDRSATPPFAYLNDIRIDDRAQGRGLGRAALAALEGAAREAGCASMQLHVFGHNTRARRLYESAGYRTTNVNMRKDFA